jgi:outer membrane protein OmpA-like peptidoglycan-associated protein
VTALADREGDYESIKTIEAVTPDAIKLSYAADIPAPAGSGSAKARKVNTRRTVRRDDLRNAHEYMQVFSPSSPETIGGTTAIGTSTAVLTELKTKGQTAFTFQTPGREPPMDKVLAMLTGRGDKQPKSLDDLGKQLDASKASGTLTRVEPAAVPFPVLVNGRRTTLSAIHARGTFDDLHVDFYFLDDPDNPIALKWTTGSPTGALQVVQIAYAEQLPAPQIEQALKESGRAEVHGIYFDFASATIKPESEPMLKEIADAIAKNPAWTLSVEGHTDNVGGDAPNLELSKRRAEAVKQALTTRYHVAPAKLTTAGFGAAKPKEPNTTPEGRARNRRVELVKQ